MTHDDADDLFAPDPDELVATRDPRLVQVGASWCVCLDGVGGPGGPEHAEALAALCALGRALLGREPDGPETFWHLEPGYFEFSTAPDQACNWTLALRIPSRVGEAEVDAAVDALYGDWPPLRHAAVLGMEEGGCVQMLHTGPPEAIDNTLAALRAYAESLDRAVVGRRHDIPLDNPPRLIVRLPVI